MVGLGEQNTTKKIGKASPVGYTHEKVTYGGRQRNRWRDYISGLAWLRLDVESGEMLEAS